MPRTGRDLLDYLALQGGLGALRAESEGIAAILAEMQWAGSNLLIQCKKALELAWRGLSVLDVRRLADRALVKSRRPAALFAWFLQRLPQVLRQYWAPHRILRALPLGVKEMFWGKARSAAICGKGAS